jgi:hypothetical protein
MGDSPKYKSIKLIYENIGKNFCGLVLDKDFLDKNKTYSGHVVISCL